MDFERPPTPEDGAPVSDAFSTHGGLGGLRRGPYTETEREPGRLGPLSIESPPQAPPAGSFAAPGTSFAINAAAELVADLVAATGLLPEDKIALARGRARTHGSFAEALVAEGLATPEGLARALARRHGLPFVDLSETGVSAHAGELVPPHVLERIEAMPYAIEGDRLLVAIADPGNVQAVDELRLATGYQTVLAVASRADIAAEITRRTRFSAAHDAHSVALEEVAEDTDTEDDLEAEDGISDAPLVRLVNSIIFHAAEDGASDIHFEPQEDSLVVRLRVDGVLTEVQRIPRRLAAGVTTRLKVLAKLDIAERRKPQDGRITLNAAAAGRMLDIRVATLPTVEGESVVMRLLDKSKRTPTLESLGLSDEMRLRLEDITRRPTGALLVTGPTGSGKSTTLYAALGVMNRPEVNIITVEDPVEYRLAGINQVQINVRAGLTFATALRSILRSDPDIVMVGEIRDPETAKISIEAALTGHFVMSTLHTNDAPGTLTRLNEMGVEPFLTGSAVSAVLAQRLVRKLCTHCCEMYTPTTDELLRARVSPDVAAATDGMVLYRKVGCPRCGRSGYRGRIGIFQLLLMSENIERLAAIKASRDEIERAAIAEGMRTLWDDGLAKVAEGFTSLEELARVCA
jgi:type IV pilus assembly protein PilB